MLKAIINFLKDSLAPQVCFTCNQFIGQQENLCARCLSLIRPVVSTAITLKNGSSLNVLALGSYEGPLQKLILAKSYSGVRASSLLGNLMIERMPIATLDFDIIVPVPLHWTRYAWRGYNQAKVMAKKISAHSGKPVIELVKRNRRTLFQSLVQGKDRQKNVKDAFILARQAEKYRGKKMLLIDDLYTSGATLQTIAHQLLALEPKKMVSIVAARVAIAGK